MARSAEEGGGACLCLRLAAAELLPAVWESGRGCARGHCFSQWGPRPAHRHPGALPEMQVPRPTPRLPGPNLQWGSACHRARGQLRTRSGARALQGLSAEISNCSWLVTPTAKRQRRGADLQRGGDGRSPIVNPVGLWRGAGDGGGGGVCPVTRTLSPGQMEEFQIYEKYCQNKPRSESLWRQCSDSPFFQVRRGPPGGAGLPRQRTLARGPSRSHGARSGLAGMPAEAGPQAQPGLLPAEAGPENHQVPAAAQGGLLAPACAPPLPCPADLLPPPLCPTGLVPAPCLWPPWPPRVLQSQRSLLPACEGAGSLQTSVENLLCAGRCRGVAGPEVNSQADPVPWSMGSRHVHTHPAAPHTWSSPRGHPCPVALSGLSTRARGRADTFSITGWRGSCCTGRSGWSRRGRLGETRPSAWLGRPCLRHQAGPLGQAGHRGGSWASTATRGATLYVPRVHAGPEREPRVSAARDGAASPRRC